jgi:ABC-type molybdenum transport system ATPase subunit/photorepair protein PhrA
MANAIQNRRLEMYLEAERAVLSGQSYTIGNRTLTRASLSEIRKAIDALIAGGATIDGVDAGSTGRSKRVLFVDGR